MTDHYKTLNVTRDAEPVVIESAYRALMKRYHPDKTNGDPIAAERAKQINAAYSVLKDPSARARYDRTLDPSPSADFEAEVESTWPEPSPEPVRPSAPSTARGANRGALTSAAFMLLAATVGVGAIGSIFNSTPEAAPDTATDVSDAPAPAAADMGASVDSPQPLRSDAPAAPLPAPEAEPAASEQATGEKCISADSAIEYLICADPAVAEADRQMTVAYSARLATADDPSTLRDEQRAWLSKRDRLPSDRDTLLAAYAERTRQLEISDIDGLF